MRRHCRAGVLVPASNCDLLMQISPPDETIIILAHIHEETMSQQESNKDLVRRWFAAFPDYKIEIDEVRDLGAVTVAAMRAVAHGAGSEVPLEDATLLAVRWRKGKAVWWQVLYTWEEALEAVGLSEQDAHADS